MRKYIWLLAALPLLIGSCRFVTGKRVHGNGVIKSEERSVSTFKNVEVSGAINVYVSQGDIKPVKIEGDENLLQYIEVEQEGDKLFVREKHGYNLKPTAEMRIYVTAPVYNNIDVSGACDIIGMTKISNPENLALSASGAGDIKMEVDAPKLSAEISGSGSIDLKGQTKDVDLQLTGAGHAHCYDLLSENTKVDISGAGSAQVYASVKLDAEVSGAGSVSYKGNATNVIQHTSGVGSVTKVE
ncbi:MAG TPA: head GIN domain-containing protein [Puia sp.]|nr:head GIN domain-containing protein [Puia sp.]